MNTQFLQGSHNGSTITTNRMHVTKTGAKDDCDLNGGQR